MKHGYQDSDIMAMDETPVWQDMLSDTTGDRTGAQTIRMKTTGHEKNKPFKKYIREKYDEWMAGGIHEFTVNGNMRGPPREMMVDWILAAWDSFDGQLLIDFFKNCALTVATDGSEDAEIHCLKPSQPCAAGLDRLKRLNHSAKARLKVQEEELRSLHWEHEVLQQRFSQTQSERDELYGKFVKAIHEVQQKSNFKNLLLEKKLAALADTLEKKEAQLNEVLSASNLDPTALTVVTRKLEDVLDSKNSAIKDLQYELARVCKAHNDLIRTYEAKLQSFGVPTEELGFKPLESNIGGQQLGRGPAGLVAAPT
ncbi:growth arrest-specific protein 8-like [Orbicella faveolata]|uniref:growth arrest-specific protein 8-like n=1 Tax=Orbicella faveolata TaxID=48498 RepID=UPI0009E4D57D|nr:growth arrest-specific protein 8-like [Orbicella faveolata]